MPDNTPDGDWERGTNENANGLIRQYLSKRKSMKALTQWDCNRMAKKLNTRSRKRLSYQTPEDCIVQTQQLLYFKLESKGRYLLQNGAF